MSGVSIPGCGGGGALVSNVVMTLDVDDTKARVRMRGQALPRIDQSKRRSLSEVWDMSLGALRATVEG